jgi:hypothetical protein
MKNLFVIAALAAMLTSCASMRDNLGRDTMPDTCALVDATQVAGCRSLCKKQQLIDTAVCRELCRFTTDVAEVLIKEQMKK